MKLSYEDYQVVIAGLNALREKIDKEEVKFMDGDEEIEIKQEMIDVAEQTIDSIGTY